ncbi:thioredoxin family protein [Flavivirga spongiicola]|uniref:Thioredoxin family protein n=1 Tax=Flavivirga spongiicola TaxID=421621 RepID=A0ABU7XLD5_9FLAO|nr:thioredoxin family protein [Flavivirga sp. MEBiC05379]MDO5981226.1 thioredoxin family protein [Flavivirga sp. MEBiC05379]
MMTKVIKVLGTGCPKCKSMTRLVQEIVSENNIDATIEKVEDIMEIMTFNIMTTPALVIDNEITIKGRVPSKDEVLSLLKPENNSTSKSSCSQDNCC